MVEPDDYMEQIAELMTVKATLLPADMYNPVSPNLLEAWVLEESQSEPEPESTIRKMQKTKQQLELEAMRRVRKEAARAAEGQTMHVLNEPTSSDSASSDSPERGDTEGLNFGETSESLGQPRLEPESQPQVFSFAAERPELPKFDFGSQPFSFQPPASAPAPEPTQEPPQLVDSLLVSVLTCCGLEHIKPHIDESGFDNLSISQADDDDWNDIGVSAEDGRWLKQAMRIKLGYPATEREGVTSTPAEDY
jgi:hypothetical protein